MKISPINLYGLNNQYHNAFQPYMSFSTAPQTLRNDALVNDSFVKVTTNQVTFTGIEEHVIKKLGNIECPYCGIKMLTKDQLKNIETKLDKRPTAKTAVSLLREYREYMQDVEKEAFDIIEDLAKENPQKTLTEILQPYKAQFLIKLRLEEFQQLDKVDKLADSAPPEIAYKIRLITTEARQIIAEDKAERPFRRKPFLNALRELEPEIKDKEFFKELYKTAIMMPKSGTSVNAWMVKYADRTHHEIAACLVRPSLGTIEHVRPKSPFKSSDGRGENSAKNYLLVSARWNNERHNLPLSDWVDLHPEIPKNCQKYIDKVIGIVNRGGMKGYEWYPYVIRDTLRAESNGKIILDVSKMKLTEELVMKELRDLEKLKEHFNPKDYNKHKTTVQKISKK